MALALTSEDIRAIVASGRLAVVLGVEWHVVRTVGPDHVGIGLDLVGGRSCAPADASGYPDLLRTLRRSLPVETVSKVAGQNWLRVLDAVLV